MRWIILISAALFIIKTQNITGLCEWYICVVGWWWGGAFDERVEYYSVRWDVVT